MTRQKEPAAPQAAAEETGEDRRERFVLHGGSDDIPESVPDGPGPEVDLEQALRHLDDPERRRIRERRHSDL